MYFTPQGADLSDANLISALQQAVAEYNTKNGNGLVLAGGTRASFSHRIQRSRRSARSFSIPRSPRIALITRSLAVCLRSLMNTEPF
jgi:hypothetical protein